MDYFFFFLMMIFVLIVLFLLKFFKVGVEKDMIIVIIWVVV